MSEEKLVCYSPSLDEILVVNFKDNSCFIEVGDFISYIKVKEIFEFDQEDTTLLTELSNNVLGEL